MVSVFSSIIIHQHLSFQTDFQNEIMCCVYHQSHRMRLGNSESHLQPQDATVYRGKSTQVIVQNLKQDGA